MTRSVRSTARLCNDTIFALQCEFPTINGGCFLGRLTIWQHVGMILRGFENAFFVRSIDSDILGIAHFMSVHTRTRMALPPIRRDAPAEKERLLLESPA